MKVSIIIVNFNTGKYLKECIKSLVKYEEQKYFEIIIVDNCSTDNSKDIIYELASVYKFNYITLDKKKSFSFANNQGFELATGEYILIMNPDIIFTEPVLSYLIQVLDNYPEIGVVSPALIGTDGKFQRNYFLRYPTILQFIFFYSIFAKFFYRFPTLMNKYLENQEIDISIKKKYRVEQIPCAFFLTKQEIFEETGMMDEKFFLFFEDVDLSYRIHQNYELVVDTSLKIKHLGGSSFQSDDNWWMYSRFIKSMLYFFRKHYSYIRYLLLKIFIYINSTAVIVIEVIKKILGTGNKYRLKKHLMIFKNNNDFDSNP